MAGVAQLARFVGDSLVNLVSRMGTDRDKAASSFYGFVPLTDDQIIAAYRTAWLPRKIVDIPAFDSVRAWRDWQAKGSGQGGKAKKDRDGQIGPIEDEEKRLNIKGKVLKTLINARLWGGAALMIGTGDSNLQEPLDVERIKKGGLKYLTVLTRRHLSGGDIDRDPASEFYGQPASYTLTSAAATQVQIHPSRLVIFHGNEQPDEDAGAAYQGWGDSVLQSTLDAIKQADNTAANIASLVFESKIDIIRIPDFMASLADESYKRKIIERYTLANTSKGINGTLMLDKEEEYESKTASFATLPDVLDRFLQIVSGAADIPATRLLGQSPAGMNATGESDLRNYYDRLSATQEISIGPAMGRLDECLIRSALGARDPDIHYAWSPLWGMSEKEKADVFKIKADAARTLAGTGGTSPSLLPIEALSDALVNELIEDGSLSGLEAAIEEYGKLSEQEEDEDDLVAAAGGAKPGAVVPLKQAANDAAPRTLYVRRNVLNAGEIIAWAKGQGFATTLPASDMHVTIAFSRQPLDWMKVGEAWSFGDGKGNLTVNPGGPRMMEKFGDAAVLLFSSSDLQWRHMAIREAGASWDHPEYQPHVTITYKPGGLEIEEVEPYRGAIVLGPEIFEEVKEGWQSDIVEDGGAPAGGATFR